MKTLFLALAVLTLVVLPAWSSTPTPGRKAWEDDQTPTVVTQTVEARVVEVVPTDRTLIVVDEKERQHTVKIPEDVSIRAQSKKEFDGLRKLEFAHLREGQRLKLTFRSDDGRLVRIQVLRQS
ncbi:hypothetical protein EHM82_00850 [bacterium]|nr:MAG: hypothetical protein EHM82_00850 [bacterium]